MNETSETVLRPLLEDDWSDLESAHSRAAALFRQVDPQTFLSELKPGVAEAIDPSKSVEKTTHYKWFVEADPSGNFELWLHEYKPARLRRTGHATVPHNHRFWLTSLILRGGFSDIRYERLTDNPDQVKSAAERKLQAGDTMVIGTDEIHSLAGLQEGTISLIVQSRSIRSYSEVFEDGEVRRYSDLEAKLVEFRDSL